MPESIHWQIAEALRAKLEAISEDDGATYWYTPDRVVRVSQWDRILADTSLTQIYALRAAEETHGEQGTGSVSTGGSVQAAAEFYLLMLRRDESSTLNPFDEASPTREQIVDRMVRDFLRALWDDVTLGGLARNVIAGSLFVDRDVAIEGPWAVAEARFSVDYDYLARTP